MESTEMVLKRPDYLTEETQEVDQYYGESIGITFPYYNIDHKKGMMVDSLDSREMDRINFVILAMIDGRIYFNEMGKEPAWLCRSSHGLWSPELNSKLEDKQVKALKKRGCGNCEKCPLKNWGEDDEKPVCSQQIKIFGYDLDHATFFISNFKKTAIKPIKTILGAMKRMKLPPHSQKIEFSLISKEKAGMTWYIPVLKILGSVSKSEFECLEQSRIDYGELFLQQSKKIDDVDAEVIDVEDVDVEDMPF